MQDFDLRPEVMGFGSPIRAETAVPPVAPADNWKPRAGGFEVNGLGQLRTAFALPASEAEIAASMRHADAPPVPVRFDAAKYIINKDYARDWADFDKPSKMPTLMGGAWGTMGRELEKAWTEYEKALVHDTIHSGPLSLAPASPEGFYGKGLPSFAVAGKKAQAAMAPKLSTLQAAFNIGSQLPIADGYALRYALMTDEQLLQSSYVPSECEADYQAYGAEFNKRNP